MHKLFSGSGRVICLRSVRPEKKKRKLNSINFGRVRILLRVHEEEQLVGSQMGLGWLGPRRLACCRDSVEVERKMGSIATMSMRQLGKPKTEKLSMCRVGGGGGGEAGGARRRLLKLMLCCACCCLSCSCCRCCC